MADLEFKFEVDLRPYGKVESFQNKEEFQQWLQIESDFWRWEDISPKSVAGDPTAHAGQKIPPASRRGAAESCRATNDSRCRKQSATAILPAAAKDSHSPCTGLTFDGC